jgi:hypothetical protein
VVHIIVTNSPAILQTRWLDKINNSHSTLKSKQHIPSRYEKPVMDQRDTATIPYLVDSSGFVDHSQEVECEVVGHYPRQVP